MNCKTGVYGMIAALTIPALFFLASCEMPESIRVKASPTFQIPIPLGEGMDNSFIRPYVNTKTITEKLSVAGKKASVFKYTYENGQTQTYLINYPLFEMDLDFDEYLNKINEDNTSRVPPVVISPELAARMNEVYNLAWRGGYLDSDGNLPYSSSWGNVGWVLFDTMVIDLGDMKSLASNICLQQEEGITFTLKAETQTAAEQLRNAIRIRIPKLNIGSTGYDKTAWAQGELDGKNVVFKRGSFDQVPVLLIPNDTASEKIEIELCLANKLDAGTYTTELGFNWYSAEVYPDTVNGKIDGFELGSYFEELKANGDVEVEFASVPAYFYLSTPKSISTEPTITISGADAASFDLPLRNRIHDYDDDSSLEWLLDPSDGSKIKKYNFVSILNGGNEIKYDISKSSSSPVTVFKNNIEEDDKIIANLAVLLPMTFKFTPNSVAMEITINNGNYAGTYLPINFKELDEFLGGDNSIGDNSVMEQINEQLGGEGFKNLTFRLREIKNDVTSTLYLAVATKTSSVGISPDEYWNIIPIENDPSTHEIRIDSPESLKKLPEVKFLLKEDTTTGYTLSIKPQDTDNVAFGVKISVVAGINLDKTLDIN
jgi:hypothetical protein